jgi:hypothetical protein
MINPLNELSSVYMQNIAEDCSKCEYCGGKGCSKCDDKKDKVVLKGSSSVDGGDAAKPGKDKNYVKPMATEEKKNSIYSNWRDDSQELLEVIGGMYSGVAGVDGEKNLENPKAKKGSKSNEKITEKSIKNKIRINPPQGVTEGFAELGGVISEMYEITEKIDISKADMGDVVKDFRKSDAPQFKGKSDKKKQEMAVAAKLATEETEEEKKKRELLTKTKEHDDKQSGKIAEAVYGGAEAEKKAKLDKFKKTLPPGKGFQGKYDQHGREYDTNTGKLKEGRALAGVLSTIRAKNGMGTITAKGADKLQAKKEKTMGEEMSVKDQMAATIKYNKMNPRKPYKPGDGYKRNQRDAAANAARQPKDTRTDAQKMADATGPRKGSNYRGD